MSGSPSGGIKATKPGEIYQADTRGDREVLGTDVLQRGGQETLHSLLQREYWREPAGRTREKAGVFGPGVQQLRKSLHVSVQFLPLHPLHPVLMNGFTLSKFSGLLK